MSEKQLMELDEIRPTRTMPGEPAPEEVDETVPTPEEEAQVEKFVSRAISFIDGEETQGAVLKMVAQEDQPVHVAVGRAAARIVQLIAKSAEDAGEELDPEIVYESGQQVLEVLMETASAAGVIPVKPEDAEYEKVQERALLEGMKAYGENMLQGPDAKKLSKQAADFYAQQVAEEVDRGEAKEGFLNPVAEGVKKGVEKMGSQPNV